MKGLYNALVKKGVRIREIAEAFSEGLFPQHICLALLWSHYILCELLLGSLMVPLRKTRVNTCPYSTASLSFWDSRTSNRAGLSVRWLVSIVLYTFQCLGFCMSEETALL